MLNDGSSRYRDEIRAPVGRGTVVRDRFIVEEELDHGRFGTVYKAVDTQRTGLQGSPHYVALLVLPAEAVRGGQVLDAFKREFVRLQALNHPNIVKVFDFDRDGGVHFVTMEYVDGETLRAIVDSLRPELLWEREAVALIRAVGDALVYAHARGVVHGDVRLENVIVTAQHDVKVLFTSSCLATSAPFAVEPRDDLHGLACIGYELLAGEPPFARQSPVAGQGPIAPKRIKALSRQQWKVLRAILTGSDGRNCSVSEFLEVFGAVGAARLTEEETERSPPSSAGWRWVAAAWIAVLVGAGYVLTRGAPEEAADALARTEQSAQTPPAEPPPIPNAATEQNVVAAAAVPNVDGRIPPAEPRTNASSRLTEQSAAAASSTEPAVGSSVVTFARSTVTAAESEGVVALEIRRTDDIDRPARVIWWTSGDTARPEDDYANFGPVVETFRSGEQSRRILIPIVSDRMAEGREQFRVHLREGNGGNARLGAITQVTVTLVDDDD